MSTPEPTQPPIYLADIIPDPEVIRARLDRAETEADLLRRQLRLALLRKSEAERLSREGVSACPP